MLCEVVPSPNHLHRRFLAEHVALCLRTGMLDVQQIFGRAGRPQFQDSGEVRRAGVLEWDGQHLGESGDMLSQVSILPDEKASDALLKPSRALTLPQGIIITTHDKLGHYLGMLTQQTPIESQFVIGLVDHLNAELVLGTVRERGRMPVARVQK